MEEVEVWQDLASVYTELKQWRDAETCLEKAQALKSYSSVTSCAIGKKLNVLSSQFVQCRLLHDATGWHGSLKVQFRCIF